MPNWCYNTLTVTCKNNKNTIEYIKKFIGALSDGKMNEFIIPFKEMGFEDWDYNACVEHWGTKWEANISHLDHNNLDGDKIIINAAYDTAWAPNIPVLEKLYEKLSELDEDALVESTYEEGGMGFCGRFVNGSDEAYDLSVLHYLLEARFESLDLTEGNDDSKLLLNDDKFFIIKERNIIEEYSPIHDESDKYEELNCFSNYYNFGDGDVTIYKWDGEYFIR